MLGTILAFAGPLVGEAVSLIGRYMSASAEQRVELDKRRDAAIAEMRAAGAAEATAHDHMTEETRKAIADADAAMDAHLQGRPRP